MEKLNDVLGYKNLKIFQDNEYFSFSLDSIMLANFFSLRFKDKNIVDLGTGNGIIPLILCRRYENKKIDAVEIQERLALLAQKNINYNNLENRISVYNIDMKDFCSNEHNNFYDVVVCNPPYFKVTTNHIVNESVEKSIARHEISIKLEEIIQCASKLLKSGGNFFMVHRTERLLEIVDLLRKYKLEPKIIQYVYENEEKFSTLVLISSQMDGKSGLIIDKPFILYDRCGNIKDNYFNILTEVQK